MLKLSWLGSPYAELDGVQLRFETRKASALLAYLSLNPKENPREVLAALFWPEFDQAHALASLRRALGSLTHSLPQDTLEATRETIRWNETAPAEIDVLELNSGILNVRSHAHNEATTCSECLESLANLSALYRGDFLEGLNLPDCADFDDWQYFQREELKREYTWLLEQLATGCAAQADYEEAAAAARRWVSLDRLDAKARLTLVDIYARAGQRSLAQRQYEEFNRLWVEELGQEPDEACRKSFQDTIRKTSMPGLEAQPSPAASPVAHSLLKTKLYLPKLKLNRVSRNNLMARLDSVLYNTLTLVSAPAGFGKTSLLSEWAIQLNCPVAWLSLDSSDNDPARFLTYLSAAFDNLAEGAAANAQALLESPRPLQAQSVVTALLNDIEKTAEPLVLVLDDYQFISSESIHEAIAYLLEHITPNLHLVIASRADPPLPLARLRARDELFELRTNELRFSLAETMDFFNQVMCLDLLAEDVATLSARTEGWAVGLQMAAISLKGSPDRSRFIQTFSGSHRYILDYLIEEVLDQQPDHIRDFLLNTSILERLCSGLCEAVVDDSPEPAYRILEYLERSNLFLVPLDSDRYWHRYHHLFADLLASQLHRLHPGKIHTLHTRASRWLEENGLVDQAIEHALAAQDFERASDLVERGEQGLITQVDFFRMQGWIDRLPKEMVEKRPWIGITQGWLFIVSGKLANLGDWMDRVERNFQSLEEDAYSESEKGDIGANIASIRAYIAFFRGDLTETIEYASRALRLANPANELLLARIMVQLGETYLILQDLPASYQYLRKAIELGISVRDFPSTTTATIRLFKVMKLQGKLNEAEQIIRKVLDALIEAGLGDRPLAGKPELCLGDLLRERLDLEAAQYWTDRGLFHSRQHNIPYDIVLALTYKKKLLCSQGKWDDAERVLEEAIPLLESTSVPPAISGTWALERASLWLENGKMELVDSWIEDMEVNGEGTPSYRPEEYFLFLARVLLRQGKPGDAQVLLEKLVHAVRQGGRDGSLIQVLLLQALTFQAQNRLPEALSIFVECLSLALPERYMATFIDEGQHVRRLLNSLLAEDLPQPMQKYVTQLLQAFTKVTPPAQPGPVIETSVSPSNS